MHGCSPSSLSSEGTSIPLKLLGPVSFGNLMPQALWVFGGFRFFYYVHLSCSYVSDPSLHKLSQFMQLAMPPRLGLRFFGHPDRRFSPPHVAGMTCEWLFCYYSYALFQTFFIQNLFIFISLWAIIVPIKIYIFIGSMRLFTFISSCNWSLYCPVREKTEVFSK